MAVVNLPPSQLPIYATTGELPPSADSGDQAVVQADNSLYLFDGAVWVKQGTAAGTITGSGTANGATYFTSASAITSTAALTNGQLLVGKTGLAPVAATLTPTSHQTTITSGVGSITVGTVQNIDTTSTPTFASETLTANTNQLTLGTTNTTTLTMAALSGSRVFTLPNADSNTVRPISATTSNWVTNIDSTGVQHISQPAFSDISGTISPSQLPAFNQQNIFYVTKSGNDTTGDGSFVNPYLTVSKALTIIGSSTSQADFNDATKQCYSIVVGPGVYTENLTVGTRPFIIFDLSSALIVGNLTQNFDQGNIGLGAIEQTKLIIKGSDLRATYAGANVPLTGIQGNIVVQSTNSGSSLTAEVHIIQSGITGTITQQLGAGGGIFTLQLFIESSIIGGNIVNTSGSGTITLYAANCDTSGTHALQGTSGSVTLNIIRNVRFDGTVVTSGGGGRWFNTAFSSNAHDFTGSSSTIVADANSYSSFFNNVPTKGTVTFTLVDEAEGVKYAPTTSSNWNSVPTTVLTGLDTLATSGVAKSQSANIVLAGPASGGSAVPAFRSLVAADMPSGFTPVQAPTVNAWVYVSQYGSDVTGDGTYNKPFATTAAAQAIITDATSTKRYGIHIKGTVTETNIYLAPYTWYYGDTWGASRLNATSNNITLDPTKFASGNSRCGITNVYLTGSTGINLDFVTATASGSHVIEMDHLGVNGSITINPNNQNQYFQWEGGGLIFGNTTLHGALGLFFDLFVIGNVTVDQMATPASTGGVNFQNCFFGGTFTQSSDGTHTNPVQLTACTIASTLTVTGATTVLTSDAISIPLKAQVTLSSGGSISRTTDAYSDAYTPTTSGDWNSVPAVVQNALDTLATSGVVKSQTTNKFLGSPNGSSGVPSFRVLATADLPNTAILTTGANAWAANQSLGGFLITNSGSPVNPNDLTNKSYVDNLAQGLSWKQTTRSATTTNLPAYTYNNGTSGVGATLTGNSNGALSTQDGVTLSATNRLLVKDETGGNQPYNGIYTLTQVGDVTHPYILTRATDADIAAELQWATVEVGPDASTQAGYIYRESADIVTMGTDNVTFANVSQGLAYIFTSGVQQSGNTISAHVDNSTIDVNGSNQIEVKSGGIANTQIATAAAIAVNKLAALTANKATATDSSGFLVAATTTDTELGYVSGVTSAIQTQLNSKQATGNYITALTSDVSASGPGSAAATVNSVGGSSAANINTAELLANAATSTNTASAIVKRNASGNFSTNSVLSGYTTTVTAAGTTTLLVGSTPQQYFTGSTTQTVVLPVTSTLVLGQQFQIVNSSSGVVTVQSSGANTVQVMAANSVAYFTVILTSGTTAASWNVEYSLQNASGTVTSVAISGGTTGLTTSGGPITTSGTITLAGTLAVANGGTGVTTSTGTGNVVLSNSPTLVTPALGTPASGVLTNATGLPLTTGVTGTLPIANGGTNSITSLNNNRFMISSGGAIVEAAAVTANRAIVSDANGLPTAATTTSTEIGYVNGVTSAIQTQLNAKQTAFTGVNVSSNVTLTNNAIHFVDTSSARSLTFPVPTAEVIIVIKDSTFTANTRNITLLQHASEQIEGVAGSYIMDSNGENATFTSDGTNWFRI